MGINICASCRRLISISQVPGGNPTAKKNPDAFAMYYARCKRCGTFYCDRCVKQNNDNCPNCGDSLTLQGPPEA
jgi:tRNA G26 N,N-dimethylase Trm1